MRVLSEEITTRKKCQVHHSFAEIEEKEILFGKTNCSVYIFL